MMTVLVQDEISLPALLRAARRTYGRRMRAVLAEAGFDDVPPNGLFVIGAIARGGSPLSEVIGWLGVSKQAAGQLVDTLVLRGYLARSVAPDDRRRLVVHPTERGSAAAELIWAAVSEVDAALEAAVGAEAVLATRRALLALVDLPPHPVG